ncbi:uncharacterized protein [Miscanthus floridulus]|uniref:uncharacterized protein isoform X2 n=1 Tax=Miscanthus floridulus TaxID=154761 RepID=UPI00345899F9
MTQKQTLFKGQSKKKTIPPNRHGKAPHVRKGKRAVKPTKFTKDMDADKIPAGFKGINEFPSILAGTHQVHQPVQRNKSCESC